jgi:cytochrome P460
MKREFLAATAILSSVVVGSSMVISGQDTSKPLYSANNLIRPEDYREWVYLSSGLGMNYNPTAGGPQRFTNVFVPQWAYREFMSTGKWPDKTMFALEDRVAENKGSINKGGHFQTDLTGLAVEVKDESKFPEKWAYFGFSENAKTAEAKPKQACWQCHNEHAAVENTFVQFYPTLKPIAQKFGTYRKEAESVTPQH